MVIRMAKLLDAICKPNDIKNITPENYKALADEIRSFLLTSVSNTGGHLASNLGVVELTMALHLCLDLPKDKIIWDVGHQSYTHKILTGRKGDFDGLRSFGGISGFPKRRESDCDAFDTGHSSTSISAALGYARGRDLMGDNYTVAAVIGDGALTGGMAYEALNNAARMNSNLIIILNDNKMSISENVGGMSKYLHELRVSQSYGDLKEDIELVLRKIPRIGDSVARGVKKSKDSIKQLLISGGFFEDLGIDYLGPVDGHDIGQMTRAIQAAKRKKQAVLIHVITQKGKGYEPAEQDPPAFHGVDQFDVETGQPLAKTIESSYTQVFSKVIKKLASEDERIVGISAAMPYGTGLYKFSKRYPKRFFDVGIAEEHAVTFAAGLAAAGMRPYVAIYSSFLQRAYDQMIHDVCIPNLPVVFCIDRAGIVGADGETHQGILDLSYLSNIPNMHVFAPKNKYELYDVLRFSVTFDRPLAIRYPRGSAYGGLEECRTPIAVGKSEVICREKDIALLAVGSMVETAVEVREQLVRQGYQVSLINVRFVKPVDHELLDDLTADHRLLVTLEENLLRGGFGEYVSRYVMEHQIHDVSVYSCGIPDIYVEHGNVELLKEELGLDAVSLQTRIIERYREIQ